MVNQASDAGLRTSVICRLERSGLWGSQNVIRARMEDDFRKFTAIDYSYFLEEEFEQSLIHLPNAIEFLIEEKEDYGLVARSVANFVTLWSSALTAAGLFGPVVLELKRVVATWSRVFPLRDDSTAASTEPLIPGHRIGGDLVLDLYWDALLSGSGVGATGETLFAREFNAWISDYSSAASSANVLAFHLRVRYFPTTLKVYREPVVLERAFSQDHLRNHWQIAAKMMRRKCSEVYVSMVEKAVCGF